MVHTSTRQTEVAFEMSMRVFKLNFKHLLPVLMWKPVTHLLCGEWIEFGNHGI